MPRSYSFSLLLPPRLSSRYPDRYLARCIVRECVYPREKEREREPLEYIYPNNGARHAGSAVLLRSYAPIFYALCVNA